MPFPEPAIHHLALPDNLTVRGAAEVKDLLLRSLKDHAATEVDVPDYAPVDLSLVQILEAARISFAEEGKLLSLARPAGASVLAVLERAGITNSMNASDKHFWLHQGETQ
ncbi:STAS domain-containing protein [Rhizobium halophilum]|uniref:STAS domain-containing protein n=1 Tax=Rhizobium halophilum TaxID=2846852 RepID=UPI001EFD8D5F|nr:STAS domain-containing protein [Rhizobium halophilum]MCF6369898.1 STAS domain-containing protein [Rhizobium halophilum]